MFPVLSLMFSEHLPFNFSPLDGPVSCTDWPRHCYYGNQFSSHSSETTAVCIIAMARLSKLFMLYCIT